MKKYKTSLVLEGGGMRGAYTAGALSWLIDNNIEFDNAYGISTGAVHLCNFLLKDKKNLFDFSTKYITDKNAIGVRSIIRSGHLVDYDYLFNDLMIDKIGFDITKKSLTKLNIDDDGLNETDHRFLRTIIEKFKGGPVGLSSVAASIGEEINTLEDVYEPYLLQEGFIVRTPRGRMVTDKAYKNLGISKNEKNKQMSLWDE